MKLKLTFFYPLVFVFLLSLHAQEPASEDSVVEEEAALPEVTEPPYSIGDRANIQGNYIPLEDGISLNFRVLNNRMCLYWVDEDDLIVEPPATKGNVRLLASVRAPIYYGIASLEGEDGLGSIGSPVFPPHLFTVILSLEKPDSEEEFDVYTFRYTHPMAAVRETRESVENEFVDEASVDKASKGKANKRSKY